MSLDLTDVFDTVHHAISLTCFEQWVGIRGTALAYRRAQISLMLGCAVIVILGQKEKLTSRE